MDEQLSAPDNDNPFKDRKDSITSDSSELDACFQNAQLIITDEHMSQAERDELKACADGSATFEEMAPRLHSKLQVAKEASVNIGIVGDAGAGKSTFINSFRGLRPDEEGAAKVSAVRHTTNEVTRYPVPDNQNIVLVDFPGVIFRSTDQGVVEEFDTKSYLDLYGSEMEKCDLFLIFVTLRMSNNIIWIAKEARKMEKNVFFVRSKFDIDLANESRDHPSRFPKGTSHIMEETQAFLQKVRQATAQELSRHGYGEVKETKVFVISGLLADVHAGTYDRSNLRITICNTVSPAKKAVLLTSLPDFAIDTVHDRAEFLRSREVIGAIALNTIISLAPVPGLPVALDIGVLIAGYHRVKAALSLNDKSLKRLAELGKKDYNSLRSFVDRRLVLGERIKNASGPHAIRGIVAATTSGLTIGALAVTTLALNVSLPIVGALIAAPASAAYVYFIMREMINEMESCAVDLFKYAYGLEPGPAYIGVLGKECSSRTKFLNAIRGLRNNDPGASDGKAIKKPTEHTSSNNLVFVEFPSPQVKKSLFQRKIDKEAYRKSFGDKLKQCEVCLAFIEELEDITDEMITVAKMAREEKIKVLFVWPNNSHLSTDQSDMISKCQRNLKKLYGDIDASDIFIISTEYEAMTGDRGRMPALRHAIFKELQDADKTDRSMMHFSSESDILQLDERDAGPMLNSLPDGFWDEEMTDLTKSKDDCVSKWEQTMIRIGIISDHGAGTNTFISSLLGYREKVASRTAAGSTQTEYTSADTQRPQNLTVVRFPAVSFQIGIKEDIKSRYMKCQKDNINHCDIFLVLCGEVVATETISLTVEAMKKDKKVLFVKSKFDTECGPKAKPQEREAIMKRVKQSLADAIQAFVMLCKDYSPGMIPTKSTLLKQMVWTQAVQSGALRPWAGLMVDTPVDLEKLREFCEVYKKCFGLDHDSQEDLAELSATDKEFIQESVESKLTMCKGLYGATKEDQPDLLGATNSLPQTSIRDLAGMVSKNGSTLMTLEVANYSFETHVNYGLPEGKAMRVMAHFLRKIITEQAECAQALYEELFVTK
ncbi:PREDICTED: uncharacterized protein LOC109478698 isoform X2 [Branchiostoma belcheri]|uniref:Uncharacterized protein LOC109478698 isoform X2 n=1 Tax=Branchiostoma belcheri TaxID=7741 RepID=A0A6P4ZGS2_BRABE|nr:PREDICTED: uncharacterized protein LOC109478698 isoform X2 [Branchiostoma belcheri]